MPKDKSKKQETEIPLADFIVEYVGEGSFLLGVPAKNLSPDEWSQIDKGLQDAMLASGVYKLTQIKTESEEE